jgi:hypothetical protein
MFVVTLGKNSLRRLGVGLMCCAVVAASALLGHYISTRTVAASASTVSKIESAQDIAAWFSGYGLEVDTASVTADKVKIPRKWDDSFSAFNTVVTQSGLNLTRYKGKTVEKWLAELPAQSSGDNTCYGVLLVYKKKPVGAYLLEKPSGVVTGIQDAQSAMAEALTGSYAETETEDAQQTSGEEYDNSGDWGERHDEELEAEVQVDLNAATESTDAAAETAGAEEAALYTDLPLDAEGYPVE